MKFESPLSPHLQVYKWQLSSLLSITHRMTSIFNLMGMMFFALWIFMLFLGEDVYKYFEIFSASQIFPSLQLKLSIVFGDFNLEIKG